MTTTQSHLSIADIKDDIVLLKNGGGALVLQTSAVNFGLLSEQEQIAIISSFAQLLNSLSFSIQIMIHSERLNISSYLELLDKAYQIQTNPLLLKMMASYRQFIQTTIRENEVLDKKFYLVIPLFKVELGLISSKEILQQKIKTILWPRRDQLIRQLNRVGLRATQLNTQKLIALFYDIYNGELINVLPAVHTNLKAPPPLIKPQAPQFNSTLNPAIPPLSTSQQTKTHPFVVEELAE